MKGLDLFHASSRAGTSCESQEPSLVDMRAPRNGFII